jgi:hypothetical protein
MVASAPAGRTSAARCCAMGKHCGCRPRSRFDYEDVKASCFIAGARICWCQLVAASELPSAAPSPGFSATLSLCRIGSRDRFRDQAVEVPQTRSIKRGVVAEIEVGGAVQTPVSELQPDRLIHADAIAAYDAPQKR